MSSLFTGSSPSSERLEIIYFLLNIVFGFPDWAYWSSKHIKLIDFNQSILAPMSHF